MANLTVNTDAVKIAADRIKTINEQLRSDFNSVENAINRLNNEWDGPASTNAIGKFYEIKNKYAQPRYDALNAFVEFLLVQVRQGYTQTETVNTSLADQFK